MSYYFGMYEMYPDAWAVSARRQPSGSSPSPRRRARKEHSVVPPILPTTHQQDGETAQRWSQAS